MENLTKVSQTRLILVYEQITFFVVTPFWFFISLLLSTRTFLLPIGDLPLCFPGGHFAHLPLTPHWHMPIHPAQICAQQTSMNFTFKRICVWESLCACERERERERVCVREIVCIRVCVCVKESVCIFVRDSVCV